MKQFERALAVSAVCLVTALGALGIGEYSDDMHRDNVRACLTDFSTQPQIQECKKNEGPGPDELYSYLIFGFGGAGIFMGIKAYRSFEEQEKLNKAYQKAEGII